MSTALNIRKKFFSQIENTNIDYEFAYISKFISEHHSSMWIVGGQIRDYYLQVRQWSNDIDLATDCNVYELFTYLQTKITSNQIKFFEQYNTITLSLKGVNIDIAQLRSEHFPNDAHEASIVFIDNIIDDLKRRDFTMNSMAINLFDTDINDVIDPYNGLEAIKEKTLRVIHDQSYINDPKRIFRAARYISRFNLSITPNEESLITSAVKHTSSLSEYSINKEIQLIKKEKNAKGAINLLNTWGYKL